MLKQQPQQTMMTHEQFSRELRDIRGEFEGVRRATKQLGSRTSRLYIELQNLRKQSARGDRR